MPILISKEKALKKLRERLNEAQWMTYSQAEAWKSRTAADIHDIFPVLDHRHFEIERLFFPTTYVESFFNKAKNDAIGFLSGYIHYIEENYSESKPIVQNTVEQENFQLSLENAKLKQVVFATQQSLDTLKVICDNTGISLNEKDLKIKKLEESMLQLDGFRLGDIFRIIRALPIKDVIAILGAIAVIVGAVYGIVYFGLTHSVEPTTHKP